MTTKGILGPVLMILGFGLVLTTLTAAPFPVFIGFATYLVPIVLVVILLVDVRRIANR